VKIIRTLSFLIIASSLCLSPVLAQENGLVAKVRTALEKGRHQEALELYQAAIDDPATDKALRLKALKGRASLILVLGQDLEQVRKDLDSALLLSPKDASAHLLQGLYHRAFHNHRKALAAFDQALKHDPKLNRAYLFKGLAHFKLKELDLAGAAYEKLKSPQPHHVKAFLLLARGFSRRKQPEKAMHWCDKALSIVPGDPITLSERAMVWQELGRPEKAVEDFNQALAKNPGQAGLYVMRSGAYITLKEYEKALNNLDQAMKLDPKDYLPRWWRGRLLSYLGKPEKALEDLNQAQTLSSNNASVILDLAKLRRKIGDFDRAAKDFELGQGILPNDADFFFETGVLEFFKGDFAKAAADIEKSLSDPQAVEPMRRVWFHLAQIHGGLQPKHQSGASSQEPPDWPGKLIAMLQGEMEAGRVLQAAKAMQAKDIGAALCQANYFIGQQALILGNQDKAAGHFMECLKGDKAALCYEAALFELKKINQAPRDAQATLELLIE
jgi:tetratricopeptide (TPR) repeat protein